MDRTSPIDRPLRARFGLAAGVLLVLATVSGAADLSWTEADWAGGNYTWMTGLDPDVEPGLLVLENWPSDMRFVAEPTQMRGVYALAAYHDTLFLGCGDGPTSSGAGSEILAYDYVNHAFSLSYDPAEEGLILMKVRGDTLYVPGVDTDHAIIDSSLVYLYNGHDWILKRVPYALHVFGLETWNDQLFVTDADGYGLGSVWKSVDHGDHWERIHAIYPTPENHARRMHALHVFQDHLYAQPDGLPPNEDCLFVYDGAEWDTLSVPGLPHDENMGFHGKFTTWGDSLILNSNDRMFILHEGAVYGSAVPFSGDRWNLGFHIYKGKLYGGGEQNRLYYWLPDTGWVEVGQFGLNPWTEEIESIVTYYGRLYVATARYEGDLGGRLYVSAALPYGRLLSLPHDFGRETRDGVLTWNGFSPDEFNHITFQVRSGESLADLEASSFVGPDGSSQTYYETSGIALPSLHYGDRYFQYSVDLHCPSRTRMPFLRSVTLAVDSLTSAAVPEAPPVSGSLCFAAPRPNPALQGADFMIHRAPDTPGKVILRIVDLQGRTLRTAALNGGSTLIWHWDLRTEQGAIVPAGIYQAWAEVAGERAARPILVIPDRAGGAR